VLDDWVKGRADASRQESRSFSEILGGVEDEEMIHFLKRVADAPVKTGRV